jgi:hypothetical protein
MSQYLSRMVPNLDGLFSTFGHDDGCALLAWMDMEKKIVHMLLTTSQRLNINVFM